MQNRNRMNTVTLDLEEYLELRSLRDNIRANDSFNIYYQDWASDRRGSFIIITRDEATIQIAKANQELKAKIDELMTKKK